jgi:hypothetical protein
MLTEFWWGNSLKDVHLEGWKGNGRNALRTDHKETYCEVEGGGG